ncbi:MAG: redoxin family protein [Aureliella sp.]
MSCVRWKFLLVALGLAVMPNAFADEPSTQLVKAMSYKPRQKAVTYEQVAQEQFASCDIEEKTRSDGKGFWLTGPAGQPLRWFADTNGDNRLDQWSYFNAGVEVYRESDSDFNGTADTYRWLNTNGLRRGVDSDENGSIDTWEAISAEEVTSEVVAASAGRDADRFKRLLISETEIRELGLGREKESKLLQRVADARKQFGDWSQGQNVVTRTSEWSNFGADKPGVVPAGTDGSKQDVVVYENVVALMQDKGEARQLLVGTLVQVGNAWRVVDLPKAISEGSVVADQGVFFSASFAARENSEDTPSGGLSKVMAKLVGELQEVDAKLQSAGQRDSAALQAERADVLEKLVAESASSSERMTWIQQFADTVSAAAQTGDYPGGVRRMQEFTRKLSTIKASEEELAYVVFRTISADHNVKMQNPKAKYEELQKDYLGSLQGFVRKYPKSDDAAEAMLQIGLSSEFSGNVKDAKSWYAKASQGFRDTIAGRKASGAFRRLSMEGKVFRLQGSRLGGGQFDSAEYVGGPVVYHGWATWCEACKAEMRALKELQAKYAKSKLRIVGLNFDSNDQAGSQFLTKNSYPWVHLYEDGGLESDIAIENGFLSLPVNVVVDKSGKVVATGVHWTELDELIEGLVK